MNIFTIFSFSFKKSYCPISCCSLRIFPQNGVSTIADSRAQHRYGNELFSLGNELSEQRASMINQRESLLPARKTAALFITTLIIQHGNCREKKVSLVHILVHLWRIHICGTQWFQHGLNKREKWTPSGISDEIFIVGDLLLVGTAYVSVKERNESPVLLLLPLIGKKEAFCDYWCTPTDTSFPHYGHWLVMAWLDRGHSANQELPCPFKTRAEAGGENGEPWWLGNVTWQTQCQPRWLTPLPSVQARL